MRIDWVPFSASALVVGATALSASALLAPRADSSADLLRIVQDHPDRWLVIVGLYLLASAGLVVGLPAVLSLFDVRGARLALVATSVFAVGCLGTVAYAVLLAVYRALVVSGNVGSQSLENLARDAGLIPVLIIWMVTFLLGEALLAWALLLARTVPVWIPVLLLAHAGLVLLNRLLPDPVATVVSLMITVALAGLGIFASQDRLRVRRVSLSPR